MNADGRGYVRELAERAREAQRAIAALDATERRRLIERMATQLVQQRDSLRLGQRELRDPHRLPAVVTGLLGEDCLECRQEWIAEQNVDESLDPRLGLRSHAWLEQGRNGSRRPTNLPDKLAMHLCREKTNTICDS